MRAAATSMVARKHSRRRLGLLAGLAVAGGPAARHDAQRVVRNFDAALTNIMLVLLVLFAIVADAKIVIVTMQRVAVVVLIVVEEAFVPQMCLDGNKLARAVRHHSSRPIYCEQCGKVPS